jgi:acyl carrier protein
MTKNNNKAGTKTDPQENGHGARLVETLQAWMIMRLSEELNLAPADIDARRPLLSYGVDSVVAFSLTGELADLLGRELPTTLFWDLPTLEGLAFYLADEIKDGTTAELLLDEMNVALSAIEEMPDEES